MGAKENRNHFFSFVRSFGVCRLMYVNTRFTHVFVTIINALIKWIFIVPLLFSAHICFLPFVLLTHSRCYLLFSSRSFPLARTSFFARLLFIFVFYSWICFFPLSTSLSAFFLLLISYKCNCLFGAFIYYHKYTLMPHLLFLSEGRIALLRYSYTTLGE